LRERVKIMNSNSSALLQVALRHARLGVSRSDIPRLELHVDHGEGGENPCLYRAMACFILQGSKRAAFGDKVLSYEAGHYLVSALDLPAMGQIYGDSARRPYVALTLALDPGLLTELLVAMPAAYESETSGFGLATAPITEDLRDVVGRTLALLDRPGDIPILGPMLERELLYRLLLGPNGGLLRQIANPRGPLPQVRLAIAWIGQNFDRPLTVENLCEACGMSRASLYRSFRAITGLSPIQYQKQLRLLEARRLLLAGEHSISGAAFAVGYESSSQFSRDYLRQFDFSPSKDVQRTRKAVAAPGQTATVVPGRSGSDRQ